MGAWGTGLFENDLAADVRHEWREAVIEGLDPRAATERLVGEHRDVISDRDEHVVFWLALAAAQAETDRLQADVRDRALALIDAGGDLYRWEESGPAAVRKREKVLRGLSERLRGPQRLPTRIRRPPVRTSPLGRGDVVRIRSIHDHSEGLFVVVGEEEGWPPGSTDPVVVALLWTGGEIPTPVEMARLPLVLEEDPQTKEVRTFDEVVHTPTRGRLALSNYGDVVARGVARPDAPGGPRARFGTWSSLAHWVGGAWFSRSIELTRRMHGLGSADDPAPPDADSSGRP